MFLNSLKKIKFIFFLLFSITIIHPLRADLGEANYYPQTKEKKVNSFDAWCKEKDNKCVVSFKDNKLVVNQNSGLSAGNLISWDRKVSYVKRKGLRQPYHLYTYNFEYNNQKEQIKLARIIFQNAKSSDKFYKRLKEWSPSKEIKCFYSFELRKTVC